MTQEPTQTDAEPSAQNDRTTQPETTAPKSGAGWALYLMLAALVAAGGGYLASTHKADPQAATSASAPALARPPARVGVATVAMGDMDVEWSALGTVTSLQNVTIRTQINGQLMRLGFDEGQKVQAGSVIAEIDPRPYENALSKAEGQLMKDTALLREAEATLDRYRALAAKDSVSRQQLESQESLVQQYQGMTRADQAAIDDARLNLSYCKITSPLTGRAGLRAVDPGNYVQTSDTGGIVTIAQTQPISVLFAIPEDRVPALTRRMAQATAVPVTIYDRAGAVALASGTLAALDNQINTATGTVKMRAVFDNGDEALYPNQFVNVRVLLEKMTGILLVPQSAVQNGAQGSYVYVVQPDDRVQQRMVQTGATGRGRIQILDGLAAGDVIVTDGLDQLRDGVKILRPAPTASAPSGT